MFQTGLHIALQSLASDWLTWLMLRVTALGYQRVIIMIVIAVLFGVSLRQGFLLFQIIFWTAVLSEMIKELFGLPRPFFADSRVACLEPSWNTSGAFRAMGGRGFFGLPPQEVIEAFRHKGLSFGFPSGHTSGAIAVWGGLAVVFRKRALAWLAPGIIVLIAFTRLYLGVHFLADVLGGAVLGGLVLLGAWLLWRDDCRRDALFTALRSAFARAGIWPTLFLFGLPLLLAACGLFSMAFTGLYVGVNAAFVLSSRPRLPVDDGPLWTRLARVLLVVLLFWLLGLAQHQAVLLLPALAGSPWGQFLNAGLRVFLTVWLGIKLLLRLGLYKKNGEIPVS